MGKTKTQMENAIAELARARSIKAEYKANVAAAQAELEESGTWRYLKQQREYLETAEADVAFAETRTRKAAMGIFAETDNRVPHPAVKVKDFTALDYSDEDAMKYAREHLPKALKLIKRTFEKAAKVLELDFVTIWQEPRATIARDLSKYLPK